jgi:hypothetical protein
VAGEDQLIGLKPTDMNDGVPVADETLFSRRPDAVSERQDNAVGHLAGC